MKISGFHDFGGDMIISFVGHSSVENAAFLFEKVKHTIETHIRAAESVAFYCGGYGAFDDLCAEACRSISETHSNCETVLVTPYMTEAWQKKIKALVQSKRYVAGIYPPLEHVPLRYAILRRNEWMIDRADLIFAYVRYKCGGAWKAMCYAKRKGKPIINLGAEAL